MSSDIVSLDRPMRTRRSLQRMRFPQWSKRWNVSPSLISKKTKSLQKLSPSSSIASDTSENAASEDNILWYLQPTSKRKIEQDPVERCTMEMIFFDRWQNKLKCWASNWIISSLLPMHILYNLEGVLIYFYYDNFWYREYCACYGLLFNSICSKYTTYR